MTDDKKALKKGEESEQASPPAKPHMISLSSFIHSFLAWLIMQMPGFILWSVVFALLIGVGARFDYEAFKYGWELFGF